MKKPFFLFGFFFLFVFNILAKNGVFTKQSDKYISNLISFYFWPLGLFSTLTEYTTKGKSQTKII